MGCSTLHIKTEEECRIFLFDEEKGIATPGSYFNLEVRKGEQDLMFVSTKDESSRCPMLYNVEENDCDYRILLEKSQFIHYSQDFLENMRLAEQGDADAQYSLGRYYEEGKEVAEDYNEAIKWYLKAAKQKQSEAQHQLGLLYIFGNGVKKDIPQGLRWVQESAKQGNAEAQYSLGYCYYYDCENTGVKFDYNEAKKWLRKAAEQGYCDANDVLEEIEKNPPYYLFFDTETTGLPEDYNLPASDTRNWPRLVQLGWILTDKDGNTLSRGNEIVKPDGFVIPTRASLVHGITNEKALQIGKPLIDVIEKYMNDVKQAICLVGHNISFDQRVVGAELYRLGLTDIVSKKRSICTMLSTIDFCKIPYDDEFDDDEYKYPQLQELYRKLFGCDFDGAHDAMADITATMKCFFKLKRKGVKLYYSGYFDFENAEIVCSVKLNDFEKSEFKCQQNANGDYYLLCLPSFTGLENSLVAYASDGSGRKPDFLNDSLIIYQNGDDFAAKFGEFEEDDD